LRFGNQIFHKQIHPKLCVLTIINIISGSAFILFPERRDCGILIISGRIVNIHTLLFGYFTRLLIMAKMATVVFMAFN